MHTGNPKNNPALKIIGVSSYMEPSVVRNILRAGAKGYVSKATDIEQLEEAMKKYMLAKILGEQIAKALEAAASGNKKKIYSMIPSLTEREQRSVRANSSRKKL